FRAHPACVPRPAARAVGRLGGHGQPMNELTPRILEAIDQLQKRLEGLTNDPARHGAPMDAIHVSARVCYLLCGEDMQMTAAALRAQRLPPPTFQEPKDPRPKRPRR